MPKTLPFARNPNAARARRAKTMLLPMPRVTTDELALRVHLALATMWAGAGSVCDARTLTQTMILTGFIADQVTARPRTSNSSSRKPPFRLRLTAIATTYDEQLRRAPLWAVAEASEPLDRFQAGEAYRQTDRKLA